LIVSSALPSWGAPISNKRIPVASDKQILSRERFVADTPAREVPRRFCPKTGANFSRDLTSAARRMMQGLHELTGSDVVE